MRKGVSTNVAPYILYAEDNPTDSHLLLRAFGREHPEQELVHLENGQLVKEYLLNLLAEQAPLPSLTVLDIKMPGMSGLDVLEFIRRHDRLQRLPVILLSASEEDRDLDRAYRNRVNAYLVKPGRYRQLRELIGTIQQLWIRYNRVVV